MFSIQKTNKYFNTEDILNIDNDETIYTVGNHFTIMIEVINLIEKQKTCNFILKNRKTNAYEAFISKDKQRVFYQKHNSKVS